MKQEEYVVSFMTHYWAIECCKAFFGLDDKTAEQAYGDRGRRALLQLWEKDPERYYEHPLQILRQEWFHATHGMYRHDGFWAALSPDARVLDYGCGTGEVARCSWIARGGWIALVEPSEQCRAYLSSKYAAYRLASGYSIPVDPGGGFDAIICTDVLEHVHNPLEVQAQLWALLKPGGHALLKFEKAYPHPGHLKESIDQLPEWLRWLRTETEIIEVESYAWVRKPG